MRKETIRISILIPAARRPGNAILAVRLKIKFLKSSGMGVFLSWYSATTTTKRGSSR
jgi:hypothetical protein